MSRGTLPPAEIDGAASLERARERAKADRPAHAGAFTPTEADALVHVGVAHLIDVRNHCEREFAGCFPGANLIEWKRFRSGEINPRLIDALRARYGDDDALQFLCRSGNRTDAAAAAAAAEGFTHACNVLEGFEGILSSDATIAAARSAAGASVACPGYGARRGRARRAQFPKRMWSCRMIRSMQCLPSPHSLQRNQWTTTS